MSRSLCFGCLCVEQFLVPPFGSHVLARDASGARSNSEAEVKADIDSGAGAGARSSSDAIRTRADTSSEDDAGAATDSGSTPLESEAE